MILLDRYENRIFRDSKADIYQRLDKFANYMGRRWGIGRACGALRAAAGLIATALCTVGALFLLLVGCATAPLKDKSTSDECFTLAIISGFCSLEAALQTGRGLAETIPIVGYFVFINSDFSIYFPSGTRGMASI